MPEVPAVPGIAAVDSVELRARVWGYLNKVNFKEGGDVKTGQRLYQIDPAPFIAALNTATGLITGTLSYTSAGLHHAAIAVSDGTVSSAQDFDWTNFINASGVPIYTRYLVSRLKR